MSGVNIDSEELYEKLVALGGLLARREKYASIQKVDNGSLIAGDPMYFYCTSCNAPIVVSELYLRRAELCEDCQALKLLGWLDL